MTQAERDALKALAAKATPGPWINDGFETVYHADEGVICNTEPGRQQQTNAVYITAACNAAPALVAEVERLTARVAELEIALEAEEFARERRMDNLDPA